MRHMTFGFDDSEEEKEKELSIQVEERVPSLDERLTIQHQQIIKHLERQEQMLNKLLTRRAVNPSEMSSVNSLRSLHSIEERGPRARRNSLKVQQILSGSGGLSSSGDASLALPTAQGSSPSLFQSFTAFDLNLKEEAHVANLNNQRRKFASVRMADNALKRSIISSRQALQQVEKWVYHPAFDIFFALVVFTNAIFIGLEVESNMSGQWIPNEVVQTVNYVYTSLFTFELLVRCMIAGRSFFWCDDWLWNWLDIVIVMTSLFEVSIDIVTASTAAADPITFSSLKVFRVIRLTRVIKTVRLVRIFRFVIALRTLVTSIVHTLKALFWALTLLVLIVYVFAVLFAQAVHEHLQETGGSMNPKAEKFFGSLPKTMLSLFMSIADGVSWVDVLQPLQDIDTIWVFFFLFYVSFTYFAVLNVVTGVFCQSAIENAQKDHAAVVQNILDNKESHLKKIRALFFKLGADDTGVVTFDMLQEQFSTPAVREYFESLGLDVSDAWSFFKLLDVDGGGAVEIEEFLLGCLRLRGQARAMDIAKLMFDQNWLIKSQGKFQHFVEEQLNKLSGEVRILAAMFGSSRRMSSSVISAHSDPET